MRLSYRRLFELIEDFFVLRLLSSLCRQLDSSLWRAMLFFFNSLSDFFIFMERRGVFFFVFLVHKLPNCTKVHAAPVQVFNSEGSKPPLFTFISVHHDA